MKRTTSLLALGLGLVGSSCASAAPVVEPAPATSSAASDPSPPAAENAARASEPSDATLALLLGGRTAVMLDDGRVLAVAPDADATNTNSSKTSPPADQGTANRATRIFDPKSRGWSDGAPLATARRDHAVARLADGRVLVCGGEEANVASNGVPLPGKRFASCEVFDPTSGRWAEAKPMLAARTRLTLTTLEDGRVLAVGKPGAELFDPKTNTWSESRGSYPDYAGHSATRLRDGRVLIVGKHGPTVTMTQLFDPKAGEWATGPDPQVALDEHTAVLMPDGMVLFIGVGVAGTALLSPSAATVYEPKHARWNTTGQPQSRHVHHAAVVMPNGDVLVSAGADKNAAAELYAGEIWHEVPPALATRLDALKPNKPPPAGPAR